MLPTFFVSHGAPTSPLERDQPVHGFMGGLLRGLSPRAILMISAHWEAAVPTATSASPLRTIHDFSGFPRELYDLRYEPPGQPDLARQTTDLLAKAGLAAQLDATRGMDHGGWTPLIVARPQADIPVVQLSLVRGLDPSTHLAMGHALAPLRDDGVLIIGSGGAVHNLRAIDWAALGPGAKAPPPPAWATDFRAWLDETLALPAADRTTALRQWAKAPGARMAHPREEHLMPLHVAAGAAGSDKAELIHESWQGGSLSLAAWRFGA